MVTNYLIRGLILIASFTAVADVRLKDLARIEGARENALVGYGLVVGLNGTGDSSRNKATLQSLSNTLGNFGVNISESELSSRNSAAVMVTATMPPYAETGAHIDVQVASLGDARSLSGGTLLLTPLYGPDRALYALAQGAISVGGFRVDSFASSVQKNHVNVGMISRGATIEQPVASPAMNNRDITVLLNQPDYTTAERIVQAIKNDSGISTVAAIHPGRIEIQIPESMNTMAFVARLESISVVPDVDARVVVNERTGTIVAGSSVQLGAVSIAHGELRIEIDTKFHVSQPSFIGRANAGIETVTVPDTTISVQELQSGPVTMPAGATVGDLVSALHRIKLSTRDIITILQSIKSAGALHAELIIQ